MPMNKLEAFCSICGKECRMAEWSLTIDGIALCAEEPHDRVNFNRSRADFPSFRVWIVEDTTRKAKSMLLAYEGDSESIARLIESSAKLRGRTVHFNDHRSDPMIV